MRPRSVFVLVLLSLAALFAALNWSAFAAPTRLSFIFASYEAPLGVIMLTLVGLLSLLYVALLAKIEGTALLESRRQARELERMRKLADSGEDSRFRKLEDQIAAEFESLRVVLDGLVIDRTSGAAGQRTVRRPPAAPGSQPASEKED